MTENKVDVYVLDLTYEIVRNEPHIVIWGIDEEGRRVVLRDRSFRPYFYALLESGVESSAVISMIRNMSVPRSPITKIDPVRKRYYGREVDALRIETVIPESVREYREKVAQIPYVSEVLEADIRFVMRYMIDRDLPPSTWHRFRIQDKGKPSIYKADREYEVIDVVERYSRKDLPELRIMSFDIEVYNPQGSPRPQYDPVIIISVYSERDGEIVYTADESGGRIIDLKPIREFISYVNSYDPDIVFGYNTGGFDLPYLIERSRRYGVRLDIGRKRGEKPRQSAYGHISIPGRLHIDLLPYAEEIPEIKVKSLDNVAEYFGIMKKSERINIPWYEIPRYWDDKSRRDKLIKYAVDDVVSTHFIGMKLLTFITQLSSLTGLPMDQVGSASVGYRLEWYLMREAYKYNELVPNRVEREYEPYRGAIVLEPIPGLHRDIAVLDFTSMYPNIMIKYNIGPDTYVEYEHECQPHGCWVAPEIGYRFRKHPPGFYKRVLETLLELRKSVRAQMKSLDPESVEYRLLDDRQRALKILANAAYGYMGWVGARWYHRQGAEAVTAWGRDTIRKAIAIARELGLKVIYGDTDSLFITYDKDKVERFIELVYKRLELEIKVDKIYRKVFFTEAKKRYIGLTMDGRIDIVGFEAVRGDWSELAKEIQERVAEIVLSTDSVDKAVEYVRGVIRDLEEGKIPIEKLVIWKTITKPLDEYEAAAPHVRAAKILLSKGGRISIGDKVGYVITRGSGRISDRAYPYMFVSPKDIDTSYYIDHQIVPATLRILSYFGVSDRSLKAAAKARKTLFDFR